MVPCLLASSLFFSMNVPKVSESQLALAKKELGEYVAIRSYSQIENEATYSLPTLIEAAEFAGEKLKELGLEVTYETIPGLSEKDEKDPLHFDSPPFVLARKVVDVNLPTLILYAHYDIQPVEFDKWDTDPFVMVEKNGRLYGRGASDDKAGIISIITVLRMYKEAGIELPVNVTVLLEGEEESGSSHMVEFLRTRGSMLQAKALIVLDGINAGVDFASLTTSTRGLVKMNIETRGLEKPVHSGIGCIVPDSAMALAGLLSSLAEPGEIPGFMEGFIPMEPSRRATYDAISQTDESYAKEQGVMHGATLRGDPSHTIYLKIAEEPNISITKMFAGQPNGGNVIPESARGTINARILPGQDPEVVASAIEAHLRGQGVLGNVQVIIEKTDGMWAWNSDATGAFSVKYLQALGENFSSTGEMPCGGTLPLLYDFQQNLPDMEMIVPGVEDPATAAHSHNESQSIEVLERTINSLFSFLLKAGEQD